MGEMIGTLDEGSLYAQLSLDNIDPLKHAIRVMTAYQVRPEHFSDKRDVVQVFYPGPVVRYNRFNGGYIVEIFTNGNGKDKAGELVDLVMTNLQQQELRVST